MQTFEIHSFVQFCVFVGGLNQRWADNRKTLGYHGILVRISYPCAETQVLEDTRYPRIVKIFAILDIHYPGIPKYEWLDYPVSMDNLFISSILSAGIRG